MNENINNSNNNSSKKTDITINDIMQIISRRKKSLYIILISTLISVLIYNFIATPVYESSVVLKKENIDTKSSNDQFKEMFSMKTTDELETEMEIIKTRNVLEKVISELNLLINIKMMESSGEIIEFNESLNKFNKRKNAPLFNTFNVNLVDPSINKTYYLKTEPNHHLGLFIEENDSLLQSVKNDSIAEFNNNGFTFEIEWKDTQENDKIYFEIRNYESTLKNLVDKITVSPVGKTNIFKVSFEAESGREAQIVVTKLVEKYRESRLAQKRQTINYSVDFVNENLLDVTSKLKNAEVELSTYRSETKILSLNESTNEVVNFLSNLESKKVQTDLELAEYRSKLTAMQKEQEKGSYVDQTYLAPSTGDRGRSNFSTLLEQLSDAEIKRLELLQRRKENHPDIVAVDMQIEQIKNGLAEFNQNTMNSFRIIISTLARKQRDLNNLIYKYSARIENLPAQETVLVDLIRKKNIFENMYNLLLDKQQKLRMAEFSTLLDIIIVDPALIPNKPTSPKKTLNIILALFLGTILGVTTIFLQEFFEKKVENIDEMENMFSTSILTVIPKYDKELEKTISNAQSMENKLVTLMDDQQEFIESYRLMRTKLLNLTKEKNKAFLFTSSEADTGKTTIVANLGISLAMIGKKVLIMDCDLKKAGLSRIFNIPKLFPNYLEYLMKGNDVPAPFKPFKKSNSEWDLNILNAGDDYVENSSELLQSDRMKKLIAAHKNYDFILIDTPPVTQVVDTLILGSYVQNVIYVVKQSHTYKDGVKFAIEELGKSSMNVSGLIINGGNLSKSAYKYKYGYKYGYGDYKKS